LESLAFGGLAVLRGYEITKVYESREVQMPFTNIDHLKIYYEVHGNGDSVVMLHHGFGCAKM